MEWTTDHRHWYRKVYLSSDHWKRLKQQKLILNPCCERCGVKGRLDVHHAKYRNIFDVGTADLITLCRRCHKKEHDVSGMPRRTKISYENYIPSKSRLKIAEQSPLRSIISRKERIAIKERLMREQIAGVRR